jgi:uncharacterized membrane protein
MTKTVLGIFQNREDAENAINTLKDDGYDPKDVSIIMKDEGIRDDMEHSTGADVASGAGSGAMTGAIIGGATGFLAGTVLPGLAGFLIGGPIGAALGLTGAAATTVSGAATGAVAGGIIGALMGLGLTHDEAEHYSERVREGAILLAIPVREHDDLRVRDVLGENDATDIKTVTANENAKKEHHRGSSMHAY